jgi:hypothetical protein
MVYCNYVLDYLLACFVLRVTVHTQHLVYNFEGGKKEIAVKLHAVVSYSHMVINCIFSQLWIRSIIGQFSQLMMMKMIDWDRVKDVWKWCCIAEKLTYKGFGIVRENTGNALTVKRVEVAGRGDLRCITLSRCFWRTFVLNWIGSVVYHVWQCENVSVLKSEQSMFSAFCLRR